MPIIKAVIFDLDGTLLDTVTDVGSAAAYSLTKHGYNPPDESEYLNLINFGIIKGFKSIVGDNDVKELMDTYVEYYHNHCTNKTSLFPYEKHVLGELVKNGIRLGVFTNKTEKTAKKSVDYYFQDIPFDFVWGRDGIHKMKPDIEGKDRICQRLNLNAENIAFIGDSPETDIPFANNAGFISCAAEWGYYSKEELAASNPMFSLVDFNELKELVLV